MARWYRSRRPMEIYEHPCKFTFTDQISRTAVFIAIGSVCRGLSITRIPARKVLIINILQLHSPSPRNPATPQVVFYQTGIGSEHNFYSEYIQGATGASLGTYDACLERCQRIKYT